MRNVGQALSADRMGGGSSSEAAPALTPRGGADSPPVDSSGAADLDTVDAQLAQLKGLYEKQLVTREIYEAKQKELLNQLMPAAPPAPAADDGTELLLVVAPACEWLPFADKAIVPVGDHYDVENLPHYAGRGHAIGLGDAVHALPVVFVPTGDSKSFFIRWAEDRELGFEVDNRKMEPGAHLSTWSCHDPASGDVKPEWAVRFLRNGDGTISPADAPQLVIGATPRKQELTLVKSGDVMALKWAVPEAIRAHQARLMAEQKVQAQKALLWERRAAASIADAGLRQRLRDDGFLHLPGVAEPEVVATALREINRQLGHAQGGTDAFKAKTFATAVRKRVFLRCLSSIKMLKMMILPRQARDKHS